jgi:hypothetical protein
MNLEKFSTVLEEMSYTFTQILDRGECRGVKSLSITGEPDNWTIKIEATAFEIQQLTKKMESKFNSFFNSMISYSSEDLIIGEYPNGIKFHLICTEKLPVKVTA